MPTSFGEHVHHFHGIDSRSPEVIDDALRFTPDIRGAEDDINSVVSYVPDRTHDKKRVMCDMRDIDDDSLLVARDSGDISDDSRPFGCDVRNVGGDVSKVVRDILRPAVCRQNEPRGNAPETYKSQAISPEGLKECYEHF